MFHVKMEDYTYGKVSWKAKQTVRNTNVYCQVQNLFNLPNDNNAGGIFFMLPIEAGCDDKRTVKKVYCLQIHMNVMHMF